jgi:hypothetical protein
MPGVTRFGGHLGLRVDTVLLTRPGGGARVSIL